MVRTLLILVLFMILAACSSSPGTRVDIVTPTKPHPADVVVNTATGHLGAPYRYGGMTADGFDCSGLACVSFDAAGVRLPRRSRDQSRVGAPIDRSELRRGDLVFFASDGTINHVGIVTGVDGPRVVFVHATTRAGVRTDRLDSGYWSERYVSARRVALR